MTHNSYSNESINLIQKKKTNIYLMRVQIIRHPGEKEGRQKDGQMDGQIPPVFYRTSSPLGPLPLREDWKEDRMIGWERNI